MAFIGKQPNMEQVDFDVQSGTGTNAASGSVMFHETSGLIQHLSGGWTALTATMGSLDSLSDVASAGHSTGQIIQSNGSSWVLADHDMEAITDLDTTTNSPGSTVNLALQSDGDGTYSFSAMDLSTNVGGDLTDLDNVVTAGHTNGQVLASNGTTFVMESLTLSDQVSGAINDLTDVSTAGVATDEVLIYNGSSYIFAPLVAGSNITVAVSGISNVDTTTNSPESTAGLSMISDGDTTYSFTEIITARMTVSTVAADQNPAVVNNMYIVDSSAAIRTVTLPASHASGDRVIVKCAGSSQTNAITLATADSDTIDGAATQTLASNYGALEVVSNGTNWFLV